MLAPAALALLLAASPSARVVPAEARPGDAVLVRVAGTDVEPAGSLAERPLRFWREGGEWRALAALPIETPPGPIAASLEAGGARLEAAFSVVEPAFPSRALTVPARYVEPPASVRARIRRDRRAFSAAYASRSHAPPLFGERFAWPRSDSVTARFGDKRVLNGKKESVHYGVDLGAARGSPVHAAADGEVVLARNAYYSGKSVVLWHGADVFTIYFHLDRIDVRTGAKVKRGAAIGAVGSTGRSTGPHLHWSARVAGLLVDPESLLGFDFAAGAAPPRRAGPPVPEPQAAQGPPPQVGEEEVGEPAPTSPPSSPR